MRTALLRQVLLCSACIAACAQQNDVAYVYAPAQLRDAVDRGASHIVVREHLDLTEASITGPETIDSLDQDSQFQPILAIQATTRSIRGNCTRDPWPQVGLEQQRQPGQCVLLIRDRLLFSGFEPGRQLWVSGLYVRSFPHLENNSVRAIGWAGEGNRLWVSDCVLEGNRHLSRAVDVFSGALAHFQNVTIVHYFEGLVVDVSAATVTLQQVTFHTIDDVKFDDQGAALVLSIPQSSSTQQGVAVLQDVTFDDVVTPFQISVFAGSIFSDQLDSDEMHLSEGANASSLAALNALGWPWLKGDETELQTIREASLALAPDTATQNVTEGAPPHTLATARAGIARVRTTEEFRRAMLQPAQHILIEEHLNLRSGGAASLQDGFPFGREGPISYLLHPETRSIVGNCSQPPRTDTQLFSTMAPGQCLVLVNGQFLGALGINSELWVNGLYVKQLITSDVSPSLMMIAGGGVHAWIMDSVLEGTEKNSVAFNVSWGASALFQDGTAQGHFADQGTVIVNKDSHVRLQNATFARNNRTFTGPGPLSKGELEVYQGAQVAISNCTFGSPKVEFALDIYGGAQGFVGGDPQNFSVTYLNDDVPRLEGLSAAPAEMPSETDPELRAIRAEAAAVPSFAMDEAGLAAAAAVAEQGCTNARLCASAPGPRSGGGAPSTPDQQPVGEVPSAPGPQSVAEAASAPGPQSVGETSGAARANRAGAQNGADTAQAESSEPSSATRRNVVLAAVLGTAAVAALVAAGLFVLMWQRKRGRELTRQDVRPVQNPAFVEGLADIGAAEDTASRHGRQVSPAPPYVYTSDTTYSASTRTTSTSSSRIPTHPGNRTLNGPLPLTIYRTPANLSDATGIEELLRTQRLDAAESSRSRVLPTTKTLKRELCQQGAKGALFLGTFRLMNERRCGGQATVQFARSADGGFFQYAIKFFHKIRDYAIEERFWRLPALVPIVPDIFASSSNEDRKAVAANGYTYPPYLVMERGMTLAEWLNTPRPPLNILQMFGDVAQLLATLHEAGYAHRDLKPDNVLLMLQTQSWRLIDFGIAAPIGHSPPPACTLGYAAPEVVRAYHARTPIPADGSQDVWALGVMAFEAFTRMPSFNLLDAHAHCKQLADGEALYLWESGLDVDSFGSERALAIVTGCLARDAADRPLASELVQSVRQFSR